LGKYSSVCKHVNGGDAIERAVRLFHRRWSVATIANLGRHGPSRFTALHGRLNGASRDTLAETLRHLVAEGVAERSGTDTQPLYGLTASGQGLVSACEDAVRAVREADVVRLALKKWPMLVLVAIGRGAARYGELAAMIPSISPRALSGALRDLVEAGVAERSPEGGYRLTAKGEALQPVMERLVAIAEGNGGSAAGRGR